MNLNAADRSYEFAIYELELGEKNKAVITKKH